MRRADLRQRRPGVPRHGQVADRDDADHVSLLAHHRQAPDRLLAHQSHRLVHARRGRDRGELAAADLADPASLRVSPFRHHANDDVAVGQHSEQPDRKSTRLNSSHVEISYAVFCLKKKKKKKQSISVIKKKKKKKKKKQNKKKK